MKWQEVTYLLHGWSCTVLFDTPKEPGMIHRYDGIIRCLVIGEKPILNDPYSVQVLNPPPWATVIMHMPSSKTYWDVVLDRSLSDES